MIKCIKKYIKDEGESIIEIAKYLYDKYIRR